MNDCRADTSHRDRVLEALRFQEPDRLPLPSEDKVVFHYAVGVLLVGTKEM